MPTIFMYGCPVHGTSINFEKDKLVKFMDTLLLCNPHGQNHHSGLLLEIIYQNGSLCFLFTKGCCFGRESAYLRGAYRRKATRGRCCRRCCRWCRRCWKRPATKRRRSRPACRRYWSRPARRRVPSCRSRGALVRALAPGASKRP